MSRLTFDWIRHHRHSRPDKCALIDLATGRRLSYLDLDRRIDALSYHFTHDLALSAGDTVAVLCHNSTDILEVQFACRRTATRFLPLNWRLTAPELEFILSDAGTSVVFVGSEFEEKAQAAADRSQVRHVRSIGGPSSDYERGLSDHDGRTPYPIATLEDDATWTVMYTSGTTGRPKGAILTYAQFDCLMLHLVMRVGLSSDAVGLTVLPMFHISGLNTYANPLLCLGGTNYVMRTFDAARCLELVSDPATGLTHFMGVPTNFLFMAELPGFGAARFDHLGSVISGGQAVPIPMVQTYSEKGMRLQQGWGMTEACSLIFLLDKEDIDRKRGSVGKPVMNVGVRIVNEQMTDVRPGEIGELLLRGPQITPGYINNPGANAEHWSDGWFRTGDAFREDEDGYYFIVDRWKDMYISGGENVYPAEVERVIVEMPEVLEVAVIGQPDARWGESGRAYIVPRTDAGPIDAGSVIAHCVTRLARYKVPIDIVLCHELPHTPSGKIQKHLLARATPRAVA